ncbi:hypothetical protein AB4225_36575 [Streptomyces sp. 2RAF24]|uniref:hypothetical protein n=1 Tax=Streptomyces sp. 2RAF24 TaxID=3232997 RepID=UPI003F9BC4CD
MTTTQTVLAAVLKAHGEHCGCEGACGSAHGAVGRCGKGPWDGDRALHAAPYPPRTTDVENASVPAAELRPWCGPCWNRALKAARERAAEARRIELDQAQTALFDLSALAAG